MGELLNDLIGISLIRPYKSTIDVVALIRKRKVVKSNQTLFQDFPKYTTVYFMTRVKVADKTNLIVSL